MIAFFAMGKEVIVYEEVSEESNGNFFGRLFEFVIGVMLGLNDCTRVLHVQRASST